jgi:uncharacterized protein YcnI
MSSSRACRLTGAVTAAVAAMTVFGVAGAQAHAIVSPAVAKKGALQQFTLSVPTEKEGKTTTKIELTVPSGFAIDSFEAEPGWHRSVQSTGSGESAVVQRVTWTGGKVPTEEDAVFRFNGSVDKAKTYSFRVTQTYSDGEVVDWSGPESSDTPAPTLQALSSFGGGGGSKTLSVVAIVVAGVALLLAGIGLAGGSRELT